MRLPTLSSLPLLSLATLAVEAFPKSYQNDAISRSVELGGSVTTVTSTITARSITDQPGDYVLPLAGKTGKVPIAWEVSVNRNKLGQIAASIDPETSAQVVYIPANLTQKDQLASIILTEYLAYQSKPLPEVIGQDEAQYLQFSSETTFPETAYHTKKMTIKYRAPRKIVSHSKTPNSYLPSESTSKPFKLAGSSLNLGPFHNVPASIKTVGFEQSPLTIHYDTSEPVLAIKTLQRFAEVGFWGGNLNMEDKITLFNAGPKLRGFFSRLDFQSARFRPTFPAQILREITYPIPEGASSPYYYDSIGNISTSHFRPSSRAGFPAILEIQPRFPLLGGWSFEFTVGWDLNLGSWMKNVGGDKKMLAVPFMTGLKGVVVDEAELIVTLPEGAKNVEVVAPFPVDAVEHSVHKTYLDSTGRPRITIKKALASESNEQNIYITYTYPFYASLQKPAVVTLASLTFFAIYWIVKRLDMRIASASVVKTKTE